MKRWTPIVCFVLVLAVAPLAMACPFCRDAVASNGGSSTGGGSVPGNVAGNLSGDFNSSIYYMLGGLFFVIGLVARVIYKAVKTTDVSVPARVL
jgi:hypothetical protein